MSSRYCIVFILPDVLQVRRTTWQEIDSAAKSFFLIHRSRPCEEVVRVVLGLVLLAVVAVKDRTEYCVTYCTLFVRNFETGSGVPVVGKKDQNGRLFETISVPGRSVAGGRNSAAGAADNRRPRRARCYHNHRRPVLTCAASEVSRQDRTQRP